MHQEAMMHRNPMTADRVYTAEESDFLKAIQELKRKSPFPTWSEVLGLVKELGYRKASSPRMDGTINTVSPIFGIGVLKG